MYENPFTSLQVCASNECCVRSRHCDEETCCIEEIPSGGKRLDLGFCAADAGCVAALGGAEDGVAGAEFWGGGRRGAGEDYAGEFCSGCPGEGGLMLVFSADLEEVEEVCGAGFDGDEVLVCCGDGVGDGGDAEGEGAGDVFLDLDGLHDGGEFVCVSRFLSHSVYVYG